MRERDIEAYLVKRVKELGGVVRKVRFIGHNGAPDRVIFFPWDIQPLWVELKATGKTAEPHQVREHQRMRDMGQRVEVVDSMERVDEVLGL